MRERGTVVGAADGVVDVAIEAKPGCETCGACAEAASGARLVEGAIDPFGARVGDIVEVDVPVTSIRTARALVYLLPPLALVLGYAAGSVIGAAVGVAPDVTGAAVGIVAAAASLIGASRLSPLFERPEHRPRVRSICEPRTRTGT